MPVFAHERLLPVPAALSSLFANPVTVNSGTVTSAGLVRGQTVACTGSAAVSCALGLVAEATREGSWAAIVGLPSIGVLAAATVGVSLERTVFIGLSESQSPGSEPRGDLGAALSALIDGIDIVVIARRCVSAMSPSLVRRLQTRAQSKGSVLVIIGDPPSVSVDIRLTARTVHWEGLGEGHGHLRRRLVAVEMDGRRCPRPRVHTVWLPDASGALTSVDQVSAAAQPVDADDAVVVPLLRSG